MNRRESRYCTTPTPARKEHHMNRIIPLGAAALIVAVITACSPTRVTTPDVERPDAPASSAASAPTPEPVATPEPADTVGTREAPLAYGTVANVENTVTHTPLWDLTVAGPRVVTADIAANNQFADPPLAGNDYIAIDVHAVWHGAQPVTPWLDYENGLETAFVTADGRTFEMEFVPSPWPDIADVADLYADGAADFTVITQAPQGAAGTVRVTIGYGGLDVFWG